MAPIATTRSEALASAPAKVVLLGEHAVNREGRALATALDLRVSCAVRRREDGRVRLEAAGHVAEAGVDELRDFAARAEAAPESASGDFLAPARYVLPALLDRLALGGLDATWTGGLPVGAGLGSGAAAHCALAVAAAEVAGTALAPAEVAALAWRGDVLAHGGIASALDASACAYGGAIAYSVRAGAAPVACPVALALVVADTGVVASTGAVNAGVRERLAARPGLHGLFADLALLVDLALDAVARGDLATLGRLMHLDQLVLEKLGVSTPEIEALVDAALQAGAHGAKLSGSGGGGIVVALAPPDRLDAVAAAMRAAGGRIHVLPAAAPGARPEPGPGDPPS